MSDETNVTDAQDQKKTPQESFEDLRKQLSAAQEANKELLPYKAESIIRGKGLDPTKGNGLVLRDMLGDNPSDERADELIAKYGWSAEDNPEETPEVPQGRPTPTPAERAALDAAEEQQRVASVASSTGAPLTLDEQIAQAHVNLEAARVSGDHAARTAALQQINHLNSLKIVEMSKAQ